MDIIRYRRDLHRIPELSLDLPETCAYIARQAAGWNCHVFSPIENALCAWFDFGADSAIAFRADMDALPIQEQNQTDYASEHPGKMHACGHDGHMAIVLELGRRLSRKERLNHNILLVFQPAEETTGGAKRICDTGVFQEYGVEAIFGLHLWPGLEKGIVGSRCGELMACASEVNIDIFGKSAHIAKAREGIDALAAGMEYYRRAVAMERALPESIFRLLKFGRMESGTVRNAVSNHTRIEGSLRAFQDEIFNGLRDGLFTIGAQIEAEFGCKVEIHTTDCNPAVMNPPELYHRIRRIVPLRELDEPSMTAEDFACYQRTIPGMFFFLGLGDVPALHTNNFDFDEAVLTVGADFFEQIAENF